MTKRVVIPVLFVILALFPAMGYAQTSGESIYLPAAAINGAELIGPPPAAGSEEKFAQLETVLWMQRTRTPQQISFAKRTEKLSLATFAPIISEDLLQVNAAALDKLFADVKAEVYANVDVLKADYDVPRPFSASDLVKPLVEPDPVKSYPSGHSTLSMVYGKLLAGLFPDKAEELTALASQIGYGRVIAGVHYPADVVAGQKLGAAYAEAIQGQQSYQDAIAEIRASQTVD
ncbi:phosphatase PAP2 family protein [Roseibium sp. RKSG952]|uniref:phosphatase PAP2 family protein n=1 Tax=Roseibium sp. RKSG952 TaxID=2529384 RepID=UPI0012BC3FAC|nr:phosphatase PAP2 family protein [Roseibium sp. RKSG952]MTI00150.1 phosphatase PAP2 family protein [Roseibium sp. RKSG952]